MATPYDGNSFGLALEIGQICDLTAAKAAGFDFVSQVYAKDFAVNADYAQVVQNAANAKMPIWAEVVPYMTTTGRNEGALAEEYWAQHQYPFVDQSKTGVKRQIAGVIVSAEIEDDGDGNQVTDSNTQATLEYLLDHYRVQFDQRGKTGLMTMLRSRDTYIQKISPKGIPTIVERVQYQKFEMADWRYRLEKTNPVSGKVETTYGNFVSPSGKIVQNKADIVAYLQMLPAGFKTPPYPGSLYFWEIGKVTLPFCQGPVRVVIANGKTTEQLYTDIGFLTVPVEPPADPDTGTTPDPEPGTGTTDPTPTVTANEMLRFFRALEVGAKAAADYLEAQRA